MTWNSPPPLKDTSRDRRRRTVEAPNGARLILPVGTTDSAVLNRQMQFVYAEPFAKLIELESSILDVLAA